MVAGSNGSQNYTLPACKKNGFRFRSVYTDLFVYGSLCIPGLVMRLVGDLRGGQPARLYQARCRLMCGKAFPGIRPACGESVAGVLYHRVSRRKLNKLDRFEEDYYQRYPLRGARLECGGLGRTCVYVLKPGYFNRLSPVAWPLSGIRARGIYSRLG